MKHGKMLTRISQKSLLVHGGTGTGYRHASGTLLLISLHDRGKSQWWKADIESIEFDVNDRVSQGRGARGIADESLPKEAKELGFASDQRRVL